MSGRVQGVFYRASTRQRAQELGCRGYARNLPDGRVEVLAVGEPAAVHALIEWLRQGPPAAHVTDVNVQRTWLLASSARCPSGFGTRISFFYW